MRVRIAFDPEQAETPLEIPRESPDGETGYLDLRNDPRAVARIQEARRHVPLRNLLVAVNSDDSIFSTARCKTGSGPCSSGKEGSEFFSSVDLVFAPEGFNFDRSRYESLTQRLEGLLGREPAPDALEAELRVCPCRFGAVGRTGYCLRILLSARGASLEQAELRWGLGLARVQQALLFVSRMIRQQIAQVS